MIYNMDSLTIIDIFLNKEFVNNSDAKYQAKMFRNRTMLLWISPDSPRCITVTKEQVEYLEIIRQLEINQRKENG